MATVIRSCFAVALLVATVVPPLRGQSGSGSGENSAAPTFYKDVLPILQKHCQACHREGEIAPMALVTYQQTYAWADKIARLVSQKQMPPWFADPRFGKFSNDPSLTEEEIHTIVSWVKAETPMGDVGQSAPAPLWTRGWNIEHPNLVLTM